MQINVMMKKFKSRIGELEQQLNHDDQSGAITRPEAERRKALLDQLNVKLKQLQLVLEETPGTSTRNELLNTGRTAEAAASMVNNSNDQNPFRPYFDESPSSSPTPGGSSSTGGGGLRQLTQQLKKQQDQGLDVLDEIITRQKGLVSTIGQQIDDQNEIIDDIGDGMDRTNQRLVRNTRNIGRVSRKSNTGCYWFIIILLFIAIVVVSVIP